MLFRQWQGEVGTQIKALKMKKIFWWIFNVLRTLSFFLVIICLILVYLVVTENNGLQLFDDWLKEKESRHSMVEEQRDGKSDNSTNTEVFDYELQYPDRLIQDKIVIPILKGQAYLSTRQIFYMEKEGDSVSITTTRGDVLYSKVPLKSMMKLINKTPKAVFFTTKQAIINKKYIQQVIQESSQYNGYQYKHFAIMEDGKKISLSREKHNELKKQLRQ